MTNDGAKSVPNDLKCEICGNPAIGVGASTFGAISHAMCRECVEAGREPYSTLVGGSYGLRQDTVVEGYSDWIKSTLEYYGKTEAQFWADVKKLEDQYDEYMANEVIAQSLGNYDDFGM